MAKQKAVEVGRNVEITIEGSKMTLVVDLKADPIPSASGKTLLVASTQGNKKIEDVHVGLTVYRYPDTKKGKK